MRWGFAWKKGPVELLDEIGPGRVIERLGGAGQQVPRMLAALDSARAATFIAMANIWGWMGCTARFRRNEPLLGGSPRHYSRSSIVSARAPEAQTG